MITCKIIIKEMTGGRVAVAMTPEQSGATKDELRAASVIDTALQAAGELLLRGKDIMAEGDGIKEHVKRFIARHEA